MGQEPEVLTAGLPEKKIKKCPQTAHSVQKGENKVRLKVNTLQIIKWSHMFEELRLELPH